MVIRISNRSLRWTTPVLVVVSVGLLGAFACGSSGPSGEVFSEGPFEIQATQLHIRVSNESGRALLDVRVSVIPIGRATIFSTTYGRLEPGQQRNFSYADLRGDEGTPFSLRVHRPQTIRVTAIDSTRDSYEIELPWN